MALFPQVAPQVPQAQGKAQAHQLQGKRKAQGVPPRAQARALGWHPAQEKGLRPAGELLQSVEEVALL